ncbi:MAG: ribosome small subunit-dependent GTPase A [Clostridiales bacterium]|nr:ribosome small subunit-dependent GTPase A [Clostridiales bacterium]
MLKGKIIKGIGGFYYVEAAGNIYECKARGNFRQQKTTPLAGDNVLFSTFGENNNRIEKIETRKNYLLRPSVANVDLMFIVSSTVCPSVNTYLIDRMIAIAEHKGIESVVVFTKADLDSSYAEYCEIYEKAGYKTIICDNTRGTGANEAAALIKGKTCVLAGNTGVGKSSLLNAIDPSVNAQTGQTSKKLGRGRHTTRQSSLFAVAGGYVADTPGFSSLENGEIIFKEDLPGCFREFRPLLGGCRFASCTHICEKGCAVCEAVKNGDISELRHKSYVQMYNEVKDTQQWKIKKQQP